MGLKASPLAFETDLRSRYENISKLTDTLERVFEGQGQVGETSFA